MLAGLLTTAEATTELRCLAELHCCQTALHSLGSCRWSTVRQLQTVPGPKLCSEVPHLTRHPTEGAPATLLQDLPWTTLTREGPAT